MTGDVYVLMKQSVCHYLSCKHDGKCAECEFGEIRKQAVKDLERIDRAESCLKAIAQGDWSAERMAQEAKAVLNAVCCVIICAFSFSALAAPKFYTPKMIERRGLTDAQYEYLWSIGRNPSVSQQTARNWYVRSSQNDNFCAWLDTDGKSNELSRLTQKLATNNVALADNNIRLSGANTRLVATNAALTATCENLAAEVSRLFVVSTNQLAQISSLSNLVTIVSAQADAANAKIADEIADLQAKIATYESYKTKYPLLKAVWTALITDAENRIKVLQALTGGNK